MEKKETYQLLKAISFAADKHRLHKRKDADGSPYINHPIQVALTLMETGKEEDIILLMAAVLHDTVEDTETKPEELEAVFGKQVRDLVMEVTDDKSLPKQTRKELQVTNASHKSVDAKKLKLADKICNMTDIISNPPHDWSIDRKLEYFTWAEKVANGLQGVNPALEKLHAALVQKAKKPLWYHRYQIPKEMIP